MKKILLLLGLFPFVTFAQDSVYPESKPLVVNTGNSDFLNGQKAAVKFYNGYKGPATTTLIVSILNPILGLAPAIGSTTGIPNDLMHPNYDMLKNPDYYNGYTATAKKIRSRKVWQNWGAGLFIDAVAAVAVYSIIHKSNPDTAPSRRIPGF